MTTFVRLLYMLVRKQPSPLNENARDGTKQAKLFSSGLLLKKKNDCAIAYRTRTTKPQLKLPSSNSNLKMSISKTVILLIWPNHAGIVGYAPTHTT